jgi:hypothetical protein
MKLYIIRGQKAFTSDHHLPSWQNWRAAESAVYHYVGMVTGL